MSEIIPPAPVAPVPEREERRKPAHIGLFGTLEANRVSSAPNWMDDIENHERLKGKGLTFFNPNRKGRVSNAEGIDTNTDALQEESYHLVHDRMLVMNFEGSGGARSLAELRIAMIAAIVTGKKLIITFDPPSDARNVQRSRWVAQKDIEFFQGLYKGALNIQLIEADNYDSKLNKICEAIIDEYPEETVLSIEDTTPIPTVSFPIESHPEFPIDYSLDGSSQTEQDLRERQLILDQIRQHGASVYDTHKAIYSGQGSVEEREDRTKGNRQEELDEMSKARTHLVYIGDDPEDLNKKSTSRVAAFATALLYIPYNKSTVRAYIAESVKDKSDVATVESHINAMSETLFMDDRINLDQLITITHDLLHLVPESEGR